MITLALREALFSLLQTLTTRSSQLSLVSIFIHHPTNPNPNEGVGINTTMGGYSPTHLSHPIAYHAPT